MSEFDPDVFLNTQTDTPFETSYVPVPENEYIAVIDNVKARQITTKQGEAVVMDVAYNILEQEELKSKLGFNDKMLVRQSIFPDIENGVFQFGPNKNVPLGQLRKALKQDKAGKPWSPKMLEGAGPVKIKVEHRPNPNDPLNPYANVTRVAAA
jgi:hypothetical protein